MRIVTMMVNIMMIMVQVMKQNRAKEAKELLAGRGSEAKKVFQRNSSQGQMNFGVGQLVRKPNSGAGGVRQANGTPEAAPAKPPAPAPIISEAPPPVSVTREAPPPSVTPEVPTSDDIAPPPPAFDSSPGNYFWKF